jgi:hypothetical protein
MSIDMVTKVLKSRITPASHKLAALMLAEGTNQYTGVVWRSMASIAACVGVSPRQAKRIIRDLQVDGVILVLANRTGGAHGVVPIYKLNASRLFELTPTGDASVTRVNDDGCHAGQGRVTSGAPTGDIGVTHTGIGTRKEPKNAQAHAREPSDLCGSQSPNSRHQDDVQPDALDSDVAVSARAKLRLLADELRARNE